MKVKQFYHFNGWFVLSCAQMCQFSSTLINFNPSFITINSIIPILMKMKNRQLFRFNLLFLKLGTIYILYLYRDFHERF